MRAGHDVYVEALLKVRVRLSLVTVAGVYLAVLCVILEPVCFCLATLCTWVAAERVVRETWSKMTRNPGVLAGK